ncbi:unnamed protein product, partial [Polarella glacialis]
GMDENVETFIAFTGAPREQAEMYLEMAGGSVEIAVEIFMSSQEGGGEAPMEVEAFAVASAGDGQSAVAAVACGDAPEWWSIIWPSVEQPPEAWRNQRLDNGGDGWKGGIAQPKNGPCGVLAVVHGLILANQHSRDIAEIDVGPDATAKAILDILLRCRPQDGAVLRLVRPQQPGAYQPGAELDVTEFSVAAAAEVRSRIGAFQGPGGIIDLVYSAVFTRGFDLVKQEALSEGGELPLVPLAFNCWLCSMELMSLLLRGCAKGNVGAFCADGSPNTSWEGVTPIGILSRKEKETGIPMADSLKSPPSPVWVLHGGDHFTVAWARSSPPADAGAQFALYHWNGLPPGGPRLAEMAITAVSGSLGSVSKEVPKFYKPEPGEIDEVVQADPEDKKSHPGQYRLWRYEVLLAWDRPDLQAQNTQQQREPKAL